MDAMKRILVPTDFSAHADEAFRLAHTLARLTGAEVIFFHVAQPPTVVSEGGKLLANPGKADAVNLRDRFQSMQPADPKVRVEHQVIVADRPRAGHILEMLDKLGCDLIVMGTHRRSWGGHALAVEVVAVYLWQTPEVSYADYLARLEREGLGAVEGAGRDELARIIQSPRRKPTAQLHATRLPQKFGTDWPRRHPAPLPPRRESLQRAVHMLNRRGWRRE
jgi:nucleotide-binding universal stress UspA family protein